MAEMCAAASSCSSVRDVAGRRRSLCLRSMNASRCSWSLQRLLAVKPVAHFPARAFAIQPWQDAYLNALACGENERLQDAKGRLMDQWQGDRAMNQVADRNHHYNRSLRGLEGPNALGVHLTYMARQKFRRGTRGKWGLARRSVGRLRHLLDMAASP
ncbi:unnamed protein product [Symbiodinium natans]|uniref:Uncharacterized protein n=1 Tax=Symbiodinium natans TaxID=878477 RepID=A0A812TJ85_9DINO|nr:unnamed protein product [Symbiodinium natans]